MQALTDIPMGPSYGNENAEGTLPRPIAFFLGTLALVVLLAASFNYVNLSVARSLTRSREVGVRKALGAQRWQITAQFVTEAILVALGSLMLALLILPVFKEAFNRLWIVEQMGVGVTSTPGPALYGIFASLALLVGLGAGLYPGWVLARFEPSRVLKASAQTGGHVMRTAPRKVLIALQFGVTLLIASSAAVVYQQSTHFAHADYGFQTEGLAYVRLQDAAAPCVSTGSAPGSGCRARRTHQRTARRWLRGKGMQDSINPALGAVLGQLHLHRLRIHTTDRAKRNHIRRASPRPDLSRDAPWSSMKRLPSAWGTMRLTRPSANSSRIRRVRSVTSRRGL